MKAEGGRMKKEVGLSRIHPSTFILHPLLQ